MDRIKNLGKYAHKPKHVDVGKSEDDMSSRLNTKMPERGQRAKTNRLNKSSGGIRG